MQEMKSSLREKRSPVVSLPPWAMATATITDNIVVDDVDVDDDDDDDDDDETTTVDDFSSKITTDDDDSCLFQQRPRTTMVYNLPGHASSISTSSSVARTVSYADKKNSNNDDNNNNYYSDSYYVVQHFDNDIVDTDTGNDNGIGDGGIGCTPHQMSSSCSKGGVTISDLGEVVSEVFDLINEVSFHGIIDRAERYERQSYKKNNKDDNYDDAIDGINSSSSFFLQRTSLNKSFSEEQREKKFLGFIGYHLPSHQQQHKKVVTITQTKPVPPSSLSSLQQQPQRSFGLKSTTTTTTCTTRVIVPPEPEQDSRDDDDDDTSEYCDAPLPGSFNDNVVDRYACVEANSNSDKNNNVNSNVGDWSSCNKNNNSNSNSNSSSNLNMSNDNYKKYIADVLYNNDKEKNKHNGGKLSQSSSTTGLTSRLRKKKESYYNKSHHKLMNKRLSSASPCLSLGRPTPTLPRTIINNNNGNVVSPTDIYYRRDDDDDDTTRYSQSEQSSELMTIVESSYEGEDDDDDDDDDDDCTVSSSSQTVILSTSCDDISHTVSSSYSSDFDDDEGSTIDGEYFFTTDDDSCTSHTGRMTSCTSEVENASSYDELLFSSSVERETESESEEESGKVEEGSIDDEVARYTIFITVTSNDGGEIMSTDELESSTYCNNFKSTTTDHRRNKAKESLLRESIEREILEVTADNNDSTGTTTAVVDTASSRPNSSTSSTGFLWCSAVQNDDAYIYPKNSLFSFCTKDDDDNDLSNDDNDNEEVHGDKDDNDDVIDNSAINRNEAQFTVIPDNTFAISVDDDDNLLDDDDCDVPVEEDTAEETSIEESPQQHSRNERRQNQYHENETTTTTTINTPANNKVVHEIDDSNDSIEVAESRDDIERYNEEERDRTIESTSNTATTKPVQVQRTNAPSSSRLSRSRFFARLAAAKKVHNKKAALIKRKINSVKKDSIASSLATTRSIVTNKHMHNNDNQRNQQRSFPTPRLEAMIAAASKKKKRKETISESHNNTISMRLGPTTSIHLDDNKPTITSSAVDNIDNNNNKKEKNSAVDGKAGNTIHTDNSKAYDKDSKRGTNGQKEKKVFEISNEQNYYSSTKSLVQQRCDEITARSSDKHQYEKTTTHRSRQLARMGQYRQHTTNNNMYKQKE